MMDNEASIRGIVCEDVFTPIADDIIEKKFSIDGKIFTILKEDLTWFLESERDNWMTVNSS